MSTVDDDAQESDERFMVTLRNPDGATLDDHTGEGTIRDNDDDDGGGRTPELSIGDAAVQEGGTAQFEVTLRPASDRDGDGELRDGGRDGQGGLGLHREIGDADFHSGATNEDDLGVDGG